MPIPVALLVIKPPTVGRGEAPDVLMQILKDNPVNLRLFRQWSICNTTLDALGDSFLLNPSRLNPAIEQIHADRLSPSWICLFTHIDRVSDPTSILESYCGPLDHKLWMPEHLRFKYGGFSRFGRTAHPSDTVVHIAQVDRAVFEANLLFQDFDESKI